MDTWLVVTLVVLAVAIVAGVVYWYTHRTPPTPAVPVQYLSGGESYMITMGIGTPSEIPAFLLLGLSTNPGVEPEPEPTVSFSHVYMYRRRHRR